MSDATSSLRNCLVSPWVLQVQGHVFADYAYLASPFQSIIEDPWIYGQPHGLSRVERRALRNRAPELPVDSHVYFFDGASRRHESCRSASYGALLRVNGVVAARVAVFIGDHTNNEAEYMGILSVMKHALNSGYERLCIYGDSKLVINQLGGTWKCHAPNLVPYYEDWLRLVRRLHDSFFCWLSTFCACI